MTIQKKAPKDPLKAFAELEKNEREFVYTCPICKRNFLSTKYRPNQMKNIHKKNCRGEPIYTKAMNEIDKELILEERMKLDMDITEEDEDNLYWEKLREEQQKYARWH